MIRVVADVGSSHSTCILTHIDSWIDQSCSMNQLCACTWIMQSQSFGMDQWTSLRLELVGVRYMLLHVGFCCTCTHACNVVAEYVKFDLFEEIICAHTHVHVHAKNFLLFFLYLSLCAPLSLSLPPFYSSPPFVFSSHFSSSLRVRMLPFLQWMVTYSRPSRDSSSSFWRPLRLSLLIRGLAMMSILTS